MKPADLIFVVTGGPNFETDYSYNSLSDYPGDKRKLVEILRETGAEHIVFMAGDSHATYVTKVSIRTNELLVGCLIAICVQNSFYHFYLRH
jgi:hypothetical protein